LASTGGKTRISDPILGRDKQTAPDQPVLRTGRLRQGRLWKLVPSHAVEKTTCLLLADVAQEQLIPI
jgi:hypothetical protein